MAYGNGRPHGPVLLNMFSAVMPEVAAVDCLPAAPASPHEDTDTDQAGELLAEVQEGEMVLLCPGRLTVHRSPFVELHILNRLLGGPSRTPLGVTRPTLVDIDVD